MLVFGHKFKLKLTGRIDIHPPLCSTDLVLVSTALGVALRVIDEGLHRGRIVAAEALSYVLNPGVCVTVVLLTAALDAPEDRFEKLSVPSGHLAGVLYRSRPK